MKTLQLFLDGEVQDEATRNKIENKLLECNDCIENFKLEKSIREVIKTKLACKNCPEEVAQAIRIKIKEDV
jgi:anti-sigma factor (TIGR02949 family)